MPPPSQSGITTRSIAATLVSIGVLCFCTFAGAFFGGGYTSMEFGIAGLLLAPFLGFALLTVLGHRLYRRAWFTRAELATTLYATLFAYALILGVWWPMLRVVSTVTRGAEFSRIDALPERFIPYGPELLDDEPHPRNGNVVVLPGTEIAWSEIDFHHVGPRPVANINGIDGATRAFEIRVPLAGPGSPHGIAPGEPYALSALLRTDDLGADTRFFCRVFGDDTADFLEEPISGDKETTVSYLQREGFERYGSHGLLFPPSLSEGLRIRFGIQGSGSLEVADVSLRSVGAIEQAYTGRELVTPEIYATLTSAQKTVMLQRPDSWFSIAGLRFLFWDYIRAGDWWRPALAWGGLMVLVGAASFVLVMIMRRQWIDHERLPLPLLQVPRLLLGLEDAEGASVIPRVFRNPLFWVGFAVALLWCSLKIWAMVNSSVPDTNVFVPLKPYFNDPGFGRMWSNVYVTISVVVVGLAVFIELNILTSLVFGFFLYRAQFWFGESTGLSVDRNYPAPYHQILSAFLTYGLIIVALAGKYLARYGKEAWHGVSRPDDPISPRGNLILLVILTVALAGWCQWTGIGLPGGLVLVGMFVACTAVIAKLQAECGVIGPCWGPRRLAWGLSALGGMTFYGPEGILIAIFLSFLFTYGLTLAGGPQLEWIEIARETGVPRRQVPLVPVLGLAAGLIIGGWSALFSMYAIGVENTARSNDFNNMRSEMRPYSQEMPRATEELTAQSAGSGETGDEGSGGTFTMDRVVMLYAGGATAATTVLRQFFAGFWLHPIAFITGPSTTLSWIWSSLLIAAILRATVLRLGGAVTVREKLFPAAAGLVVGGVAAQVLFFLVTTWLRHADPELANSLILAHPITRLL